MLYGASLDPWAGIRVARPSNPRFK
jgi:hypothetical protein